MNHEARRRTSVVRKAVLVLSALTIVVMIAQPVAAAPDDGTGQVAPVPPAQVNPTPNPLGEGNNPNGGDCPVGTCGDQPGAGTQSEEEAEKSPIAKQCDGEDVEIPEENQGEWGVGPATWGCGAITALDWTVRKLGLAFSNTQIDLLNGTGRNEGNWFGNQTEMLRVVTIWTIPPIFLVAVMHAVFMGSIERLLKVALVYFPIAVLGTWVAMVFIQQLLYITDDISALFQSTIASQSDSFMVAIAYGFGPNGFVAQSTDGGMWVISMLLAAGLLMATVVVYIILSIREASIYIAALFLPLGFAMLIWPPMQKHFKKLVEFLFGMILSKVIMVMAIALMVSSISSLMGVDAVAVDQLGLDGGAATQEPPQLSAWQWITVTITTIFTFFVVCFAPNIPSKLFAGVGFDDSSGAQVALLNRFDTKRKIDWANRIWGVGNKTIGLTNALGERAGARRWRQAIDPLERERVNLGLDAVHRDMTDEEIRRAGFHPPGETEYGPGGTLSEGEAAHVMAFGDIKRLDQHQQLDNKHLAQVMMNVGGENLMSYSISQGQLGPDDPGRGNDVTRHGWGAFSAVRHWQNGGAKTELVINGYNEDNSKKQHSALELTKMLEIEAQKIIEITRAQGGTQWNVNLHLNGTDLAVGGRDLNSEMDIKFADNGTRANRDTLNRNPADDSGWGHYGKGDPRYGKKGDAGTYAMASKAINDVQKQLETRRRAGESIPEINFGVANIAVGTGIAYNGQGAIPHRHPRMGR